MGHLGRTLAILDTQTFDSAGLDQLKAAFLRHMPDFKTFAQTEGTYFRQERAYKNELVGLFQEHVAPLTRTPLAGAEAAGLSRAFHRVLTTKLPALGRPQDLTGWQALDRIKPGNPVHDARLGQALWDLLAGPGDQFERIARYIQMVGDDLRERGISGPYGIARLLGSCALMLLDPARSMAVRPDLFREACPLLTGGKFPTSSDEPGRYRVALDLAQRVYDHLSERWGWQPRDLIDVQGFLWVALKYGSAEEHEDSTEAPRPDAVAAREPATIAWDPDAYSIDEALDSLFLSREEFERILRLWQTKKNMVLQGAPGVGKSFVARRLAYALMDRKDPSRIEAVQFHQSYGYEDFVQGYRPTEGGGFELRDGVFYRFCEIARADPGRPHVFLIDEINRGNLSKIFGELMLLIEPDKRSPDWAARLAYARSDEDRFYVPENVFLLGMMNTADRSLSMVDYALRRRFGFVTLEPAFGNPRFETYLAAQGVPASTISRIVGGMSELNAAIADDKVNLGPGYRIGHSFFVPSQAMGTLDGWFEQVIDAEIGPLLDEYWFDDAAKADEWRSRLLSTL